MNDATASFIVVVDDDPDTLNLTKRLLANGGYEVITCSDSTKALDVIANVRPDLVLVDVTMPGLNGYQVCSYLQQNADTAYIPVVFATARDEEQDKARAFAAGAADYLVKPMTKDRLLTVVKKHLETRSRWYRAQTVGELEAEGLAALETQAATGSLAPATARTYRVRTAPDFWDEAPLPQKYLQFRELLGAELNLGPEALGQLAQVRSADVYSATEHFDLTERELAEHMAKFFGLNYVDTVDPKSIQLGVLPTAFCRSNHVVAVKDAADTDAFVLSNPFSWGLHELDVLHQAFSGRPYRLLLTHRKGLSALFFDGAVEGKETSTISLQEYDDALEGQRKVSMEHLLDTANQVSAVEIVNSLIADSVQRGASDLHIEPERNRVRVRYRIDGRMRSVMPLQSTQLPSVVARIKIMCGMDMSENRKPQDGGCMARVDSRDVELRVSTLPGTHGEIVVLRVLGQNIGLQRLENLGFEPDMLRDWRRLLAGRQGMILITGPTGSGKTTSLYASLNHLNTDEVNILTVEDPVEIDLEGINQVQVHDRAGRTFASTLRSMLRQDPDIIMVGEIRDLETAEIACRAALTGHLVLSTVHTQHTLGTLVRLFDMGVAPYLAASSLNGVLAQRLVHRICEGCAEPYDPPVELKHALEAKFGSLEQARFRKGRGCNRCLRTGTKGRVGVYELLLIDDDLRQLMTEGVAPSVLREHVTRRGFRTMEEDAFIKACRGIVPPEEIVHLGLGLAMDLEEAPPEGTPAEGADADLQTERG